MKLSDLNLRPRQRYAPGADGLEQGSHGAPKSAAGRALGRPSPGGWAKESDRQELERLLRASTTPSGLSRRARAVLLMVEGVPGVEIARLIGYTVVQVSRIRCRFAESRLEDLQDRPRSGRPATISARKRAPVVALTLKRPTAGHTHWNTRDLADCTGGSHMTVHRLWQAHALQPHLVETFKFTTDPLAEEKIHDIVGLYYRPARPREERERAVLLG